MSTSSVGLLQDFALWDGVPFGIFPAGRHFFAADLGALRELAEALCQDLREERFLPLELIADVQRRGCIPAESDLNVQFALPRLRDFLSRHRPQFERAAHHQLVESTLRYGRQRLEHLRTLGAAELIVGHTAAQLASVEEPNWSPAIDFDSLAPDATNAAVVNIDARTAGGEIPISIDADVSILVLLAAQCCVAPDATELSDVEWLDELEWTPLAEESAATSGPPSVLRVGLSVYSDSVERLEFALVPQEHLSTANALAILAVTMPEE